MVETVKKGIFFSLDAVLALGVALAVIGGVGVHYTLTPELKYQGLHSEAEDLMSVLSTTRAQNIERVKKLDYVKEEDYNKTLLELIGSLWASGNKTASRNLTRTVLSNLTQKCWELDFSDRAVENSSCSQADTVSVANRIASGYRRTEQREGYVARGYLTQAESKLEKSYIFFGGYVGDGNITKNITLENLDPPLINASMELSAGGNFTLAVNGQTCGEFMPSNESMSANAWDLNSSCEDNFASGENTVSFDFTGNRSYISGGFLKVVYRRTGFQYSEAGNNFTKYEFPGIHGVVNLYSSLYVPGDIQGISGKLHYKTNGTLFLRLGNATVYRNQSEKEVSVTLENSSIHSNISEAGLNYKALSQTTVPLRLGLEEIEGGVYKPVIDSASVIDVSGSMAGSKLDEAKNAAKTFSSATLNVSGNRAGMVAYESGVRSTHPLTTNETSLNSSIEDLYADGGTCIGCGILEAIQVLEEPKWETIIPRKSEWKYNTSFPHSQPPEIDGENWTQLGYDDSSWNSSPAILGFGPDVDSDTGNNGGDYFFRKTFNYDREKYKSLEIAVRSDDAATVYLNGEVVDNDTEKHNGTYWNRLIKENSVIDLNPEGTGTDVDVSKYCPVSGGSTWYGEYIQRVEFNGIDRTTGDNGGYIDATDSISNASIPTKNYEITVTFNTGYGYDEYAAVAFDWNNNKDISDDPVYKIGHCSSNGCEVSKKISIPQDAVNGSVLMRVMGEWNHYHTDPCSDPSYNEIEDYSVFVSGKEEGGLNKTRLNDGENIIAVHLKNNDSTNAEFDLALNGSLKRNRSMVVMSDGKTNEEPPNFYSEDLSGPVPNNWYCDDGADDPCDDAIHAACLAKEEHNITVYTIGFGSGADDKTLNLTAQCGGGKYYFSETGELVEIFKNISRTLLELSFMKQTVATAEGIKGKLFKDSYLRFNYTGDGDQLEYGEIPLQFESDRFGGNITSPKSGWFWVGNQTEVLEARVTSYSSEYWTSLVNISDGEETNVYDLSRYGNAYTKLGDPYTVRILVGEVSMGNNTVTIDTAISPTNFTGGSPDSRAIYRLAVEGSVGYGDSFSKYQGGNVTVETEMGDSYEISVGNTSDPWDPGKDALDDMVERLLDKLDADGDGQIGIKLTQDNLDIKEVSVENVPFLWGPSIFTLKVW